MYVLQDVCLPQFFTSFYSRPPEDQGPHGHTKLMAGSKRCSCASAASFLPRAYASSTAATPEPGLKLQPPMAGASRRGEGEERSMAQARAAAPRQAPEEGSDSRWFPREDALSALPAPATRTTRLLSVRPCATRLPGGRAALPAGAAAPPAPPPAAAEPSEP